MTLLIGSFEGAKVSANPFLYRHNDFVRQWMSLDGVCRFFETLEIVDEQCVGQSQIFCPEFLHDDTECQPVFLLWGLRLGQSRCCRQNRDPKHDRADCYCRWTPITSHDPSPLFKSVGSSNERRQGR